MHYVMYPEHLYAIATNKYETRQVLCSKHTYV